MDNYVKNQGEFVKRAKIIAMTKIKIIFFSLIFLMPCCIAYSQEGVDMAKGMRSSGRIYVVIAVILTILLGLILYVVRLERKISRLEKNKSKDFN